MITIPKEVQEFLPGKLAWVATASISGEPNVTPKGTLKLLDGQHVTFADLFTGKTRQNLRNNPKVAVTVADLTTNKAYQLKGVAELIESGALFSNVAQEVHQAHAGLPEPRYVVKIAVDAVFDQSGGPEPGKQIA
jgi:hypothetical protein